MKNTRIAYQKGYKYQTVEDYEIELDLRPPRRIKTKFIDFDEEGTLRIRAGYAWDGPSGPAFDTPTFMRASLVHDALYQLMREKHLDSKEHRDDADRVMRALCLEDGMWSIRAWWCYRAVRRAAAPAAKGVRPVYYAPHEWRPQS